MIDLAAIRRYLGANMEQFGRVINPRAYYLPTPPFHKQIYSVLSSKKIGAWLIVAPRGHAKSTLAGEIKPLHHLFYTKTETGPRIILLVSKTQGHSIRLLSAIKRILNENRLVKMLYGEWGMSTAWKWRDEFVILKDGSAIYALGTQSQLVGFKEGDQRPTLIILDDPEDKENTKTQKAMENNYSWVMQDAFPALSDSGEFGIIGTPIRAGCLVEQLKDSEIFTYLHFSAELDPDKKIALWPEKMSWSKLMKLKSELKKKNRLSYYTANYLCKITSDSTQLFRPEHWRYFELNRIFKVDNKWFIDITVNGENKIKAVNLGFGVDPASSTEETACNSANCVTAMDRESNYYVIREFADKIDPLWHGKMIIDWIIDFHPLYNLSIESVQYQTMLRSYIRDQMRNKEYGKLYKAGIHKVRGLENKEIPRESKTERFREGLQPIQASNRIFVQKDMRAWMQEFELYTRRDDPSDRIDAFFYSILRLKRPFHRDEDAIEKTDEDDDWRHFFWYEEGGRNWKTV